MSAALIMQAEPYRIYKRASADRGSEYVLKDGERILERSGWTVTYFDAESQHVGQKIGYEPLRISCNEDVLVHHLGAIPGYFNLHFRQRANRETGKAELQLTGLDFAGEFVFGVGAEAPAQLLERAHV